MRKNNEGYVLPFVLVVMIVLTIIATSLMTAALRNLQSQQKFTERMETKYAAEGEIEKIVAQLSNEENFVKFSYEPTSNSPAEKEETLPLPSETDVKAAIESKIEGLDLEELIEMGDIEIKEDDATVTYVLNLKSSKDDPLVSTTIKIVGKIKTKERDIESQEEKPTFSIEDIAFTYTSYEISTGGGT